MMIIHSLSSVLLPFPLLLLSSLVLAQQFDNANNAKQLISSSAPLSSGTYLIRNIKTGQTLAFIRDYAASLTNVHPQSGDNTIDLEKFGDGLILSGGNNKCLSAQWNVGSAGSFDHAGVSYACEIGSSDQNALTMVSAKQIWLFVPRGTTPSNNPSAQLLGTPDSNPPPPAASDSIPCQHPDWWINSHPEYVTGPLNHVECASALTAGSSRRMTKRSQHSEMARSLQKRDTVYNIIATDHIQDMITRALSGDIISTFGGYTSTALYPLDVIDENQAWTVTQV